MADEELHEPEHGVVVEHPVDEDYDEVRSDEAADVHAPHHYYDAQDEVRHAADELTVKAAGQVVEVKAEASAPSVQKAAGPAEGSFHDVSHVPPSPGAETVSQAGEMRDPFEPEDSDDAA